MAEKKGGKGGKAAATSPGRRALYEVSGTTLTRKRRACPKCGPGVFLGEHPNRVACGRCGYTEFKR